MKDKDILLNLRRQYSKDEAVKALNIEIGKLKSEISELKDKNKSLSDSLGVAKKEIFNLKIKGTKKKQSILFSDRLPEKFKAKVIAENEERNSQ